VLQIISQENNSLYRGPMDFWRVVNTILGANEEKGHTERTIQTPFYLIQKEIEMNQSGSNHTHPKYLEQYKEIHVDKQYIE
jgi:hypothetical protein